MQGRPVWLASYSRRNRHGIIGTSKWTREEFERGYQRLCAALSGVGDESMERLFRMNVTLCLHRAATAAEVAALPASWHGDESGAAGGPVEVLWSKGIEAAPSCLPCESPGHGLIPGCRPDLWVPIDCGRCEPCVARASLRYCQSPTP
jgi:hypothetical protein